MGLPSYMRSVVDRNVVMRRMTIFYSTKSTSSSSLHRIQVKFVWGRRRHFVARITSKMNLPFGQNA